MDISNIYISLEVKIIYKWFFNDRYIMYSVLNLFFMRLYRLIRL